MAFVAACGWGKDAGRTWGRAVKRALLWQIVMRILWGRGKMESEKAIMIFFCSDIGIHSCEQVLFSWYHGDNSDNLKKDTSKVHSMHMKRVNE